MRNEWFQSPKSLYKVTILWFGQIWILCDAGVWHTRIFECSPIEWHSASSVFRTSPSESFTKIVRKYQTQKRTNSLFYTFSWKRGAIWSFICSLFLLLLREFVNFVFFLFNTWYDIQIRRRWRILIIKRQRVPERFSKEIQLSNSFFIL